jgi:hypothetical protein
MATNRGAGGWLTGVVLAHLLVTLLHGRAHAIAAVALSAMSAAFIGIVIVAAPLAGLAMTRYTATAGHWTIACSLTGAFMFGLVNHFVIESPDHVAHVTAAAAPLFATTAVLLGTLEIVSCVFGQEHSAVAQALGLTVEHSRQLLRRAKARLSAREPRLTGTAESRRDIAERFARVFAAGDEQALTALLARDVGLWSDGGGKATAARRPLIGRDQVLRLLIGLHRTADAAGYRSDVSLRIEDVNAEPALLVYLGGRLDAVFVFSITSDVVNAIRIVRNPDKLARLGRQLTTLH